MVNTFKLRTKGGEDCGEKPFLAYCDNENAEAERFSSMTMILRQIDEDDKLTDVLKMEVLQKCYPRHRIEQILSTCHVQEKRVQKLTMLLMVYFVICMSLWSRLAQRRVVREMGHHVSLLMGPQARIVFASAPAISERREQLGSEPMRQLFEQSCTVMGSKATPGTFVWGRRLMALDGTLFDVPDTPANAEAFGRSRNQFGEGPFPQVRCVLMIECGSHATVDVEITRRNDAEDTSAMELVQRGVTREMLLLHDAGITGGLLWAEIRRKGAHVIAPIPEHMLTTYCRQLKDGSYLAAFVPEQSSGRKLKKAVLVRVIEYQLTDERLGEPGNVYRLGTTLLNPQSAPLREVILVYHERWEVELVIDEQKTHVRQQRPVLRSKTPEGVRQELYGLFLLHYAIRFVMYEAASEKGLDPDRLSLTTAICVVQHAVLDFGLSAQQQHEALYEKMKWELLEDLLPPRCVRINPRVLKKLYRKYKQKKRIPPELLPEPFSSEDRFLDFVLLI